MRERRLLHDGQDVGLTHDGALFAVHLDLGAGVFAGEHLIAHLDGHGDFFSVHQSAGAYRGYGATQGAGHPVKQPEEVSKADSPVPDWFQRGVRAALLAPTAMNQQKFAFTLQGGSVAAKAGTGFYTKVDLGIAKYHFEIGAGTAQFRWAP